MQVREEGVKGITFISTRGRGCAIANARGSEQWVCSLENTTAFLRVNAL
jgi:hypothetical protein